MCSLIALAGLFTAASASATSYPNYTLFKLSPDNAFNARSLDGSPAAFYFLPGSGENANDWILYFQGGA
jgi:Pectinacetylesterase